MNIVHQPQSFSDQPSTMFYEIIYDLKWIFNSSIQNILRIL